MSSRSENNLRDIRQEEALSLSRLSSTKWKKLIKQEKAINEEFQEINWREMQ